MQKIRNVQKFPFKKMLLLNWYQTAIAHLLLFKYLKQKHNNCVYFLISEQGILLKSTSPAIMKSVQEQIDRFFTAKIQKLQISQTPQFYENILKDIQEETEKLKDSRDCPYINLIYSEKLKNSCLAMRKFGYSKPYENWQSHERQRKGFCYLIVRPEHRWKQIAGNVLSIVKKRQNNKTQHQQTQIWPVQISYEKFVWLYKREQFKDLKQNMDIKENKTDNTLNVLLNKQLTEYSDLERQLSSIKFKYIQKKLKIKSSSKQSNIIILSSFQLQKLTELIYHEFGLPKLVRQLRRKCSAYVAIGSQLQSYLIQDDSRHILQERQDIDRIHWQDLKYICKLGRKHSIVQYEGSNYVLVRFDRPLKKNIQKMLSTRLPCLPKYYCYYQKDSYIYMLRKYQLVKLKTFLQDNRQNLFLQIQIIASFIQTLKYMHTKNLNIGPKFADNVFIDQNRVIIEPSQNGSNVQDISKLTLMLREWVKQMKCSQIKEDLQKLDEPNQMLQVLDNYLSQ